MAGTRRALERALREANIRVTAQQIEEVLREEATDKIATAATEVAAALLDSGLGRVKRCATVTPDVVGSILKESGLPTGPVHASSVVEALEMIPAVAAYYELLQEYLQLADTASMTRRMGMQSESPAHRPTP